MWWNNLPLTLFFISFFTTYLVSFISVFPLFFVGGLYQISLILYIFPFVFPPFRRISVCCGGRTEMHNVCDNWSSFHLYPDGLATDCLSWTGFHSHQQLPVTLKTCTASMLERVWKQEQRSNGTNVLRNVRKNIQLQNILYISWLQAPSWDNPDNISSSLSWISLLMVQQYNITQYDMKKNPHLIMKLNHAWRTWL